MVLSPSAVTIAQLWHPSDSTKASSDDVPTVEAMRAELRQGVRYVRVVLPSEAFRRNPEAIWRVARPVLDMLRDVGFSGCEACLYADQRLNYADKAVVARSSGRVDYAYSASALVRLGQPYGSWLGYDLINESNIVVDPNDNVRNGEAQDALNRQLVTAARGENKNALLTISAPRFASPDQAAHMHYYGDSLCELGIDWYFRLGDGDYKKIRLDRSRSFNEYLAAARAEFAPVLALAERSGRRIRVREWGGVDLNKRNDWMTSTVLLCMKTVLAENQMLSTAAYWLAKMCFRSDGTQPPLASPSPDSA